MYFRDNNIILFTPDVEIVANWIGKIIFYYKGNGCYVKKLFNR